MKRYSIMAAVAAILCTAGARESGACVSGVQQPVTDARPVEVQRPANVRGTPDTDMPQASSDKGNGTAARAEVPNATVANSETQSVFYILAEFRGSLNAKKLKPGDQVKAEVSQDVLAHGKIVIPVESKLLGHVTEVKTSSKGDRESRLGVVFDKVLLKNHNELGFQGVIQALSPPAPRRSKLDDPDPMTPPVVITQSQTQSTIPMGGTPTRAGAPTTANAATPNSTVQTLPDPNLPSTASRLPSANMTTVVTRPNGALIVRGAPSDNIGTISKVDVNGAGGLAVPQPMSSRMPRGVFGLKGLSLATGSRKTPGPIIFSETGNVKLEDGTQVLLRVTDVPVP
jgi:biotin carboxyl carrier protein